MLVQGNSRDLEMFKARAFSFCSVAKKTHRITRKRFLGEDPLNPSARNLIRFSRKSR